MTQEKRVPKNNVKITQIPLSIQVSSSLGILNFLSENYNTVLQKPNIIVEPRQQEITFKNAVGRQQDSSSSDEDYTRKKVISKHRVMIKPQNMKKKYFKVDIPVSKGPTGGRSYKQKVHFVFQFNNDYKGTLTVIDDIYDCQMEITNSSNENQLSLDQRIKLQDAKLDARRRQQRVEFEQKKDGRKKEKAKSQ